MGDACVFPSLIRANSLIITGGDFTQTAHNVHRLESAPSFEAEAKELHRFVSVDAFHDSCKHAYHQHHNLTPEEIDIVSTATQWALSKSPINFDRVLHLDLSACTASEYVAQHIAELFEQQDCLRGTFFFRSPEHTSHPERLFVTTLAYQLGVNVPETIPSILGAIRADPYILTRTTKKQMRRLILEPLRRVSSLKTPSIFIISTFPDAPSWFSLSAITQAIQAAAEGEDYGCVRFLVLMHGLKSCAYAQSLESLILWDVRRG